MSKKIKIGEYSQSYKQERGCLVHFAYLANTLLNDEESARDNHVLACNSAKYLPIKNFTDRLSNKPFLVWLLTTHRTLICSYTTPCNLSSMACFADVNVSQGSVATYSRCGGSFNIPLTCLLYTSPSPRD